jgi:hydroxyethylthiazole kinase-like sugar kinase family protein
MANGFKDTWDRVVRFWPIVLFIILAAVAVGETRVRVASLEDKLVADRKQWELIRENNNEIIQLKADLHFVKQRTSDDAFSDWTAWRATTDAKITGLEVEIKDLQRNSR